MEEAAYDKKSNPRGFSLRNKIGLAVAGLSALVLGYFVNPNSKNLEYFLGPSYAEAAIVKVGGPYANYQGIDEGSLHVFNEGDELWISEGVYKERVSLRTIGSGQIKVRGGYNRNFTENDPAKYPTIIDGENQRGCLEIFRPAKVTGLNATRCKAMDGSGILAYIVEGDVTLEGNIIENSENYEDSTGVGEGTVAGYFFKGKKYTLNIFNNIIRYNKNGIGTAIHISVWSEIGAVERSHLAANIQGNSIHSNITPTNSGSAIAVMVEGSGEADVTIGNNNIKDNIAGTAGSIKLGALEQGVLNALLENNNIDRNKAKWGSGVSSEDYSGHLTLKTRTNNFNDNESEFQGGTMEIKSYKENPIPVDLWGDTFNGSKASLVGYGGAISTQVYDFNGEGNNQRVRLTNVLIVNSTATEKEWYGGQGGAYYQSGGSLDVVNTTVANNMTIGNESQGGGFYLVNTKATITDSVVQGNTSNKGKDLYMEASNVDIEYSNIGDIFVKSGNLTKNQVINADPLFVDPVNNNYTLQDQSPSVDKGSGQDACRPLGRGGQTGDQGTYSGVQNCGLLVPRVIGDVNGDAMLNVKDPVLIMQVLSGKNSAGIRTDYATSNVDVNGDNRIGLQELTYTLQKIGGLR